MTKTKIEYRVTVQRPGGRMRTRTKTSKKLAEKDLDQLLTEREDGKLAPYWNGADIFIEKRKVEEWTRLES